MIIGLIGFKQVGKSTAAKYLQEKYNAKRVNMKDALVAELKKNFPDLINAFCELYDRSHYDGMNPWTVERLFNEKPLGFRELMQNYGTEVRRGDNNNYWCDRWFESVMAVPYDEHKIIVVDDVRFLNEAEYVRKFKSKIIRLTRPDISTGGAHASEVEQLQIIADHTIEVGPGEHEKLYAELDEIYAKETGNV